MARKTFDDAQLGQLTVTKRRNARKMTLRIASNGVPNVTIPTGLPFIAGLTFARTQKNWIESHRPSRVRANIGESYSLYDGTSISVHQAQSRNSTRTQQGQLDVYLTDEGDDAQRYFLGAVKKVLRQDTENTVSNRLSAWSDRMQQQPSEVRFRATVSRWGSCNQQRVLVFSSYMAQLPSDLIDYVIIHELAHLKHMNHSSDFWGLVATYYPDYKQARRALKDYRLAPIIKRDGTARDSLA